MVVYKTLRQEDESLIGGAFNPPECEAFGGLKDEVNARAYSLVAEYRIRIAEIWVRFPLGPKMMRTSC